MKKKHAHLPYISPSPGIFLIASANMFDTNFSRAVILLCDYREEGSFGFVLNQPSSILVQDIIPEATNWTIPVYCGGPVQKDTLHFIHQSHNIDIGSKEILPGVFWGGNFNALGKCICDGSITQDDVRFFLGYSGWGHQQILEEINQESWYLRQATAKLIFYKDHKNHWRNIFKTMGKEYHILANFPDDPRLN